MKVEYSPTKNWYISKRNMELVEDRVRPYRLDYLDKLFKFIGENAEGILRRDKVKITDQSEARFKQKRWFETKTNDRVASRLEMGL